MTSVLPVDLLAKRKQANIKGAYRQTRMVSGMVVPEENVRNN